MDEPIEADSARMTSSSSKPTFGQRPREARRLSKSNSRQTLTAQQDLFLPKRPASIGKIGRVPMLPDEDNTPEGLKALLAANAYYRGSTWPTPFGRTTHKLRRGDARNLKWIPDASVHLVVTSPPYWTLKEYAQGNDDQMGHFVNYEHFLGELDKVWAECARVLVGGGRICCIVGDVCISRKSGGRHYVVPLHSDIQVRARALGLDCLTPILWHKIANGATEATGNGAGFYGKPYQPGFIIKNDIENILFLRKGGEYRKVPMIQKALSMLTREEMKLWQRSIWTDVRGASTREGHPAPYPIELAERLIRMFSFAGDTILDPFAGTASTGVAAMMSGRNSINNEIESGYVDLAAKRLLKAVTQVQNVGAVHAEVEVDNADYPHGFSPAQRVQAAISR